MSGSFRRVPNCLARAGALSLGQGLPRWQTAEPSEARSPVCPGPRARLFLAPLSLSCSLPQEPSGLVLPTAAACARGSNHGMCWCSASLRGEGRVLGGPEGCPSRAVGTFEGVGVRPPVGGRQDRISVAERHSPCHWRLFFWCLGLLLRQAFLGCPQPGPSVVDTFPKQVGVVPSECSRSPFPWVATCHSAPHLGRPSCLRPSVLQRAVRLVGY